MIDENSLSFKDHTRVTWLCTAINWAINNMIDESGYASSQWVLGRGLKLPYDLLSQTSRLNLHCKHVENKTFADRIALMSAAQRSTAALRYSRSFSHALVARSRGDKALPAQARFQLGDQVFYWRGIGVKKSAWATVWHGPAVIIGFEKNNVWLQHRNTAVKCQANHVRHAQTEEQIPWNQLLEEAKASGPAQQSQNSREVPSETDMAAGARHAKHTYLDMTPKPDPADSNTTPSAKKQRMSFVPGAAASTSPEDFHANHQRTEEPPPPPPRDTIVEESSQEEQGGADDEIDLDDDLERIFADQPAGSSSPRVDDILNKDLERIFGTPEDDAAQEPVPDSEGEPAEQMPAGSRKGVIKKPKTFARLKQPDDVPLSVAQRARQKASTAVPSNVHAPPPQQTHEASPEPPVKKARPAKPGDYEIALVANSQGEMEFEVWLVGKARSMEITFNSLPESENRKCL